MESLRQIAEEPLAPSTVRVISEAEAGVFPTVLGVAASASGAVVYPPEAYVHLLLVMFAFAAIGFLMSLAIPETRRQ